MANYEPEILNAGVAYAVPSYASFSESFLYLQESTERDWSELTKEIGLMELGVLEATGVEVVYEADEEEPAADDTGAETSNENKQSVINKLVEFIKKQWENVKGLFDDLLDKINQRINKAKEKFNNGVIEKIKKKLNDNPAKLYKDGSAKSFGKFSATFYKGLDDVSAYTKNQLKSNEKVNTSMAFDESLDDIKKRLRGEEEVDMTIDWIKTNLDKIVKAAFDFKFTKGSILVSYKALKSEFDNEIKNVKVGPVNVKVKTDSAKAHIKNLNKLASACVQLHIERQMKCLKVLTQVAVLTMGKSADEKEALRQEKEQNRRDKQEKKQQKTSESAVIESYSTEIEKLFDWNF